MANIAIVHTETHDETKPAGSRARSLGDDDIKEKDRALRERLAIDHVSPADETGEAGVGIHKKVTMRIAADPTTYDDVGYLYLKTISAVIELFYKNSAGSILQITSAGYILGTNIRLPNNTNLLAKDAAGTGTVNLIKANASDKVEIPDAAVLASSAAPTVDAAIASKKDVDDAIATAIAAIVTPTKASLGIDSGSVSVGANASANVSFAFTYAIPPKVVFSNVSNPVLSGHFTYRVSVSTTGFTVYSNAAAVDLDWHSIGTPA